MSSAYNTAERELIGKEYSDSPLGKMYRISDNSVLFEERKAKDIVKSTNI